ncbi:MAG: 50S ribosomal protein L29 [Bacteroidota bacterium]|nr:50S ribosomal protein L29 [Odoribacter sp.]MDP3181130.1 50S ribosomal protein L29 [Bacteroidota bacterium]MDP3641882.1 50S ribosomal protein L29 [Bacteroidota bacterium]
MKTSEIKELSKAEILERIQTDQDSLLRMKMNHAISPLDNPQVIVGVRRNIARLKTMLRQREINAKQS